MSLAEKLLEDFEALSDERQQEVIDFVAILKARENEDEQAITELCTKLDEAAAEFAEGKGISHQEFMDRLRADLNG
jgi:phosphoribosylaminoimidazole-succinocarboxamide synthase